MKRFERAVPVPLGDDKIRAMAASAGMPFKKARMLAEAQREGSNLFVNDVYQVDMREAENLPPGWPEITWLSIKRLDKGPVGEERFRDFQQIKNMLCGPETEAVELYPAESRLVDTANQYHLWVLKKGRWPFGFAERLVSYESVGGAVQRPKKGKGAP